MKKTVFLLALFLSQFAMAQDSTATASPLSLKKNEIKLDALALITQTRFHVSYERFLKNDFSAGFSVSLSASNKRKDDFNDNFNRTLPQYEVNPFIRYSLSKSQRSYYFVEAFGSVNGGKYKEQQRIIDGSSAYYAAVENTYTDFALGAAIGYKLYLADKFGIEIFVGGAKNLLNTDVSPKYVPRVGANFGYRF